MKYFTYIAECSDKTLYTGYCRNLKEREKRHNSGEGSKYTRAHLPVKIIYSEEFESKSEAMSREAKIKKLTRTKKLNLISSNP